MFPRRAQVCWIGLQTLELSGAGMLWLCPLFSGRRLERAPPEKSRFPSL